MISDGTLAEYLELQNKNKQLRKQLAVAVEALEWYSGTAVSGRADKALARIKEGK